MRKFYAVAVSSYQGEDTAVKVSLDGVTFSDGDVVWEVHAEIGSTGVLEWIIGGYRSLEELREAWPEIGRTA